MIKRYSQKWQRYFVKLLINEPYFFEIDPDEQGQRGRSTGLAVTLGAVMLAANMYFYDIRR